MTKSKKASTSFQDLQKNRNARQGISHTSTTSTQSSMVGDFQSSGSHFSIQGSNIDTDLASRLNQYMRKNWDGDGDDLEAGIREDESNDDEEITNVRTWGSGGINPAIQAQAENIMSNILGRKFEATTASGSFGGPSNSRKYEEKKEIEKKVGKDQDSHELYEKELKDVKIEVHNLPGRGRGMIAKKVIKPGDIIIKVQPSISTLQNQHLKRICHGCFLTMDERNTVICKDGREAYEKKLRGELKTKLNRCSRCKVFHYCSKECQISDWPTHKHECIALQRFRKMYYNAYPNTPKDDEDLSWTNQSGETVRALARIIWKRRDERERNGGKDGIWWKQIASLESHVSKSPEKEVMRLGQQAQHLQHYLSASIPLKPGATAEDENELKPVDMKDFGFESVKEVMNFCSSFHVNSFTLSSPSLSPIGVSNSPLMALSNHSCDPNAIVVFPNGGQSMELIAIKDIQADEEILTSYIDISCPQHVRQSDILERYRFSCNCSLCEKGKDPKSDWVDPRWCVKHVGCKKGEGKGRMPSPGSTGKVCIKCDLCEEEFTIDAGEVLSAVQKGKDILDSDEHQTLDYYTAKSKIKTLIPTLQTHIPNHSYPLLSLLRLSLLMHNPPQTPSDMNIGLSHIKQAYEASLEVYPENHANPTLMLCEYAKLSSLTDSEEQNNPNKYKDETTRNSTIKKLVVAIDLLNKAIEKTTISFGRANKGGIVGRDLRGVREGCEDELARIRYESRN